ncbi:MAG: HAD-IIIA family hydrolase [Gammaproteobacteria bacterium]|nr:HAD-IIIA family hydrolase [Gammaproteobacteria bacterium]
MLWDVDGVLTNGDIHISAEGECFKTFNVKDGVAVALLRIHGVKTGVLSGKSSPALTTRCKQLGLDVIKTGIHNKISALSEICKELSLTPEQVAYVGDDIIDLQVIKRVGLSFAPVDAHPLVLDSVDHVTICKGGSGVAREAAETLLSTFGFTTESMYQPLVDEWDSTPVVQ